MDFSNLVAYSTSFTEMGRKQVCETGILDTLLEVVEREETGASLCQVLEQLNSLAENGELSWLY